MAKKIVINKVIIIVLFIVLYINLLSTALLNGFWWDDIVYSLNYGSLRLIDKSVWQSIVDEIVAWIHRGRVFPVAVIQGNLIHFISQGEREITRTIQFGLVFVNILQVFWFLNKISKQFYISLLTAFMFIPLVQYRISPGFNYVEPVSGLASMMQVCFFLSMASIHAAYSGFEKIKSKRRHFLLILSAICAMMSALTYEIGLASFLAVGLIAFSKNRFSKIAKLLYMNVYNISGFLIYVCIICYVRLNKASSYSGIEIGEMRYFFHGFLVQLFGSMPLTYALFIDHQKILDSWNTIIFNETFVLGFIGIFVFIFMSLYFYKNTIVTLSKHDRTVLVIVACVFIFVPCIFMGLSIEYQKNLVFGMAYLPVYFSYFGIAFVFGATFNYLIKIWRKTIGLALIICFGLFISFLGGFHAYYNEKVFDFAENNLAYERDAVFESLKAGLMKDLDEETVVFSKLKLLYNVQDQFRSLAATVLDNPPYFLFVENSHQLPASLYYDKSIYLLEGVVNKKQGAWLALIRFDLTKKQKKNIGQVNLCENDGKYIRLINLTSKNNTNRRIFFFQGENSEYMFDSNTVVFDSKTLETRPIAGNMLRSLFNQKRLNNEYQIVELSKYNLKPCSLRVLEMDPSERLSESFKAMYDDYLINGKDAEDTLFHQNFKYGFVGDGTSVYRVLSASVHE
jgi:hypothetical protein